MKKQKNNEKDAEKIYKDILINKIYPLIGNSITYMTQLQQVGRKLFKTKFKGVFASDKIPRLTDIAPYCILNLDKSNEKGSHWIALIKLKDTNDSIIYDSFGRDYKAIFPNVKLSGDGRIRNTDRDAEQKINEDDCGARSLAFICMFDKYGKDLSLLI